MKKLYGYEGNMSKDEYIISQLKRHNSTTCTVGLTMQEMYNLLDQANVLYKKSEYWDSLFTKVIKIPNFTLDDLARMKGIGVSASDYEKFFGISHADVKRLERFGVLKVIGTTSVYKYGKYLKCPIYDITQFSEMQANDMKKLLEKYPKGKRKVKVL